MFIASMTEFEIISFQQAKDQSKRDCLEQIMRNRGYSDSKVLQQNSIDEIS